MDKKLGLLDRIQPLLLITAIALGLLLARATPQFTKRLVPVVTVGVFLVIYFIMIGIDLKGILHAFIRLKPTVLAILINFVFTPVFAWFLGFLFLKHYPDVWVGLILYLITPCIGWYLIFTELAGGDVELGISLLAWNVFLQIALMPVYMKVLAGKIIFIDVKDILHSVGVFLVLPLLLSIVSRWWLLKRQIALESLKSKLSYLKMVTLMVVIIAMFGSQGAVLFANPQVVLLMILPGLVFFSSIFIIALVVGKLFHLNYGEVALLAFTTTARNSEASLAIAATAFTSPLIPLTVVIGPSIELPVLVIILRILIWIRQKGWYASAATQADH